MGATFTERRGIATLIKKELEKKTKKIKTKSPRTDVYKISFEGGTDTILINCYWPTRSGNKKSNEELEEILEELKEILEKNKEEQDQIILVGDMNICLLT